jgi:DNA-nicking Smr family endonuclease
MSGRRRDVNDEEAALFRDALKDARPMRRKAATPEPVKAIGRVKMPKPVDIITPPPKPPVFAAGATTEIGGHREAHFRKGKLEPEARLDLHGYTQDAAYKELFRFVTRARALDQRVVLVITGKAGVLHTLLPRWLAEADFRGLVVGASPAHVRHGGNGAFYVALKRNRAP